MSEELRQLEDRLRSAMRLNFDLLEQGIALVRADTNKHLEEQEERIAAAQERTKAAMEEEAQKMRMALAAQRSIIDDGYSRMEKLVKGAQAGFEASAVELTAWLGKLDARVEALEKKQPPAA